MSASEIDVQKKIETAKEKKAVADQAFKAGEITSALMSYHQALMYLEGINKNAAQAMAQGPVVGPGATDSSEEPKPKSESNEMLEKIYSNMSACHIKNKNWKRAVETANKALAKNDKNTKALFRKAKGLGEQGFFEKAEKIFQDLLKDNPPDAPAIRVELDRLRAMDKEREKQHNQKFKGFLNRAAEKPAATA